MKKRDALKGSEDSQRPDKLNVQANVRTGRRVAVLPMENVSISRMSMASDDTEYDVSNVDDSSRRQSEVATLPGMSAEDMAAFLKNAREGVDNGTEGLDQENDEEEMRFPAFGQTLPGLDPFQMAALLQKHGRRGTGDSELDAISESSEPETLPGLTRDQMTSFMQRHNEDADGNEETSSVLSSITE